MAVAFDEMTETDGQIRPVYAGLQSWLRELPPDVLEHRRREAELLFRRIGITFAVYGEADSTERLIPFDVIPRILSSAEWALLRRGLEQRVKALNLYIKDVYGRREALKAGIVPGGPRLPEPGVPAGDERPQGAARHLRAYRRHRHRARRRRHLLRARGQCAHALRRLLHAGEPRDHDAAVPGAVLAPPRRAGRELSGRAAGDPANRSRRAPRRPTRRSCCSRPASTTRPITSTPSSPTSSASSWSRAATCRGQGRRRLYAHHRGAQARRRDLPPDRRRLPRSRSPSARIPRSACPA